METLSSHSWQCVGRLYRPPFFWLQEKVVAHFLCIPLRGDGELYHLAVVDETVPLRSGGCGNWKNGTHGQAVNSRTQDQHVSSPRKFKRMHIWGLLGGFFTKIMKKLFDNCYVLIHNALFFCFFFSVDPLLKSVSDLSFSPMAVQTNATVNFKKSHFCFPASTWAEEIRLLS